MDTDVWQLICAHPYYFIIGMPLMIFANAVWHTLWYRHIRPALSEDARVERDAFDAWKRTWPPGTTFNDNLNTWEQFRPQSPEERLLRQRIAALKEACKEA